MAGLAGYRLGPSPVTAATDSRDCGCSINSGYSADLSIWWWLTGRG